MVDLPAEQRSFLIELLTFEELPQAGDIADRAADIAELACMNGLGADDGDDPVFSRAMIGGAPFLMSVLEGALLDRYIQPVYAFSRREVLEQHQPDGSVKKTAIFRHVGFVPATAQLEPAP